MKLKDYFKKGKFYIWKEKFAIVKSKKPLTDAFAVIKDKNEITVVIDQSKIKGKRTPSKNIIKIDEDWRLLTFDFVLPFNLVGFIAKISKVLADADISIFVTSAFSTDHILVKNKNLKKTINKLKSLGFKINATHL